MHPPDRFPYQDFHLAVVCPQGLGWARVIDGDGRVLGELPYWRHRKYGLPILTPPPLSPQWGPRLYYPEAPQTIRQRQDWEWKVLTDLALQLPPVAYARIAWPHSLTYGAPWQRLGWRQQVRYTYQLDLTQEPEACFAQFTSGVRQQIRKGTTLLKVTDGDDVAALWALCQRTFAHRRTRLPFSESFLQQFVAAWMSNGQGRFFTAQDAEGHIHAMLFLVWDADTAYNLLLYRHPEWSALGAAHCLIWHAIQWAQARGLRTFDFEGSSLPGVEEFFRSFGTRAVPYHVFTKWGLWQTATKQARRAL